MGYRSGQGSGPPTWFVFLLGIAVVFGLYYLWIGVRDFMATGVTVVESTRQAIILNTATAVQEEELQTYAPTLLPTQTPVPACQEFVVTVPSAIVRERPSTESAIVKTVSQGETVCVIARELDTDWFIVDENTLTRRLEPVYMHQDIIRAVNPTPTASPSHTPAPTVTNTATFTPSNTPEITQTSSLNPNLTASNTPSPTATETPVSFNL